MTLRPPLWMQSVRFRLSLTYALAVFVAGSFLIGGVYTWQTRQLDQPVLYRGAVALRDPQTGEPMTTIRFVNGDPAERIAEAMEYNAYLLALENLRQGSLIALGVLFVVAFGIGWLLAGSALRPLHRMTTVARDITATDLSRRISLPEPRDELKD